MKYVRTKDGIYELMFPNDEQQISFDHKTIEPAYYSINHEWIAKRDVIKEADTIKELIDFIIRRHENGEFDFYSYDFETDWCSHYGDQYYSTTLESFLESFREGDYDGTIYGAIETETGIIYITKMNEKGKFELL